MRTKLLIFMLGLLLALPVVTFQGAEPPPGTDVDLTNVSLVFAVINTLDAGPGSLRAAIQAANASPAMT